MTVRPTISCLQDSLGFSEEVAQTTRIYPADPWHRVVIHNIPLRDVQEGPKGSWWKQNSDSIVADWHEYNPISRSVPNHCARGMRWLVSNRISNDELRSKGHLSVCVAFDNARQACRLTQIGAFIHGSHCRASLYRPMTRPKT